MIRVFLFPELNKNEHGTVQEVYSCKYGRSLVWLLFKQFIEIPAWEALELPKGLTYVFFGFIKDLGN